MGEGMVLLIAGLVLFIGVHLIPSLGWRDQLVAKLGELPYKGLFALVSLLGFVLLVMGKGDAEFVSVWIPPAFLAHVTKLLMLPVFVLLLAAYIPCNIKRKLKHPMLIATKLWATAHLLSNGDLASILLFGGFLAFAVIAMISAKKRGLAAEMPAKPVWMDAIVVVLGLVAYVGVAMHHQQLFGVPLF